MCDVWHSIRWIAIEALKLVLIGAHNHQVGTNMELRAPFFRFRPSTSVHVRNADAIDVRRATGQTVLNPFEEYRVEATLARHGGTREYPAGRSIRLSLYEGPGIRLQAQAANREVSRPW